MPRYRRWIWWVFWALVTIIRPLFCRFRIEGQANLPQQGGAVVASNHNYGPDFVFLAVASPRELRFMAKAEAFAWNPLLAAILRAGGVFPVKRGSGDTGAIDTAVDLARAGNLIAMFPEGTRSKSGRLLRGKTGAARIALAAGVPIVPVAITNTAQLFKRQGWRRPLVTVHFGKPIAWDVSSHDNDDDSEIARAYTDVVMGEIAAMLPEELRGEYATAPVTKVPTTEQAPVIMPK
jgi:1-acyl-sn-glycerol-3-phosphate acyltransferase